MEVNSVLYTPDVRDNTIQITSGLNPFYELYNKPVELGDKGYCFVTYDGINDDNFRLVLFKTSNESINNGFHLASFYSSQPVSMLFLYIACLFKIKPAVLANLLSDHDYLRNDINDGRADVCDYVKSRSYHTSLYFKLRSITPDFEHVFFNFCSNLLIMYSNIPILEAIINEYSHDADYAIELIDILYGTVQPDTGIIQPATNLHSEYRGMSTEKLAAILEHKSDIYDEQEFKTINLQVLLSSSGRSKYKTLFESSNKYSLFFNRCQLLSDSSVIIYNDTFTNGLSLDFADIECIYYREAYKLIMNPHSVNTSYPPNLEVVKAANYDYFTFIFRYGEFALGYLTPTCDVLITAITKCAGYKQLLSPLVDRGMRFSLLHISYLPSYKGSKNRVGILKSYFTKSVFKQSRDDELCRVFNFLANAGLYQTMYCFLTKTSRITNEMIDNNIDSIRNSIFFNYPDHEVIDHVDSVISFYQLRSVGTPTISTDTDISHFIEFIKSVQVDDFVKRYFSVLYNKNRDAFVEDMAKIMNYFDSCEKPCTNLLSQVLTVHSSLSLPLVISDATHTKLIAYIRGLDKSSRGYLAYRLNFLSATSRVLCAPRGTNLKPLLKKLDGLTEDMKNIDRSFRSAGRNGEFTSNRIMIFKLVSDLDRFLSSSPVNENVKNLFGNEHYINLNHSASIAPTVANVISEDNSSLDPGVLRLWNNVVNHCSKEFSLLPNDFKHLSLLRFMEVLKHFKYSCRAAMHSCKEFYDCFSFDDVVVAARDKLTHNIFSLPSWAITSLLDRYKNFLQDALLPGTSIKTKVHSFSKTINKLPVFYDSDDLHPDLSLLSIGDVASSHRSSQLCTGGGVVVSDCHTSINECSEVSHRTSGEIRPSRTNSAKRNGYLDRLRALIKMKCKPQSIEFLCKLVDIGICLHEEDLHLLPDFPDHLRSSKLKQPRGIRNAWIHEALSDTTKHDLRSANLLQFDFKTDFTKLPKADLNVSRWSETFTMIENHLPSDLSGQSDSSSQSCNTV